LTDRSIFPHARKPEGDALTGLAFAPDDPPDMVELLGHALVGGDDVVESVGYLPRDTDLIARHPDAEVADTHRL
jgi:hypothetical protein